MSMLFWRGTGDLIFVPTIANPAAPTASEIAAGTSVADGVTAISGFEDTVNRVGVPLLANKTDVQVDGPATFADSAVTLVEDDGVGSATADVARRTAITTLAKGTVGYLVFARSVKKAAATSGKKVSVFNIKVATVNPQWTLDANVATLVANVLITDQPQQNVSIT